MQALRNLLDKVEPMFEKGGKLEKMYPAYEALDTFLYSPGSVTKTNAHVRDGIDLKRMMSIVVVALVPCIFMALYNTGRQANLAIADMGLEGQSGWRGAVLDFLGVGYDPVNLIACMIHGALFFVPVYAVTMAVGGTLEAIFSVVRKHEINEGFLVSGMLFPLTLPPTIPLWQVADRHRLRCGRRQGGLRRHGEKLPQPSADRPSLPVLRLFEPNRRRHGLDRRRRL